MRINAEEITSILKKEVDQYQDQLKVEEEGTILEVGDGIARIYGLANALAGEMLLIDSAGKILAKDEKGAFAKISGLK